MNASCMKQNGRWVVADTSKVDVNGVGYPILSSPFPTMKAAKEQAEIANALVAAVQAATEKRYSELEKMAKRLCYEYDYAERDLRRALVAVRDSATRDLERLDGGLEIFHDGGSFARSGADVGIAAAKFKTLAQAVCSLLWAGSKAEPDGELAVVVGLYRFFRGEGVRS